MNPQNIRYLPPDSAELSANAMNTGAAGLAAGSAGANLICSFLNLGVSVSIASQVFGLHRKMDRIERKIDYIVSKVDRIDIQVAENNLRHALDYVLRQAVSGEAVDLRVLSGLLNDFEKFLDSLPLFPLLNFNLQLSSDIRGRLQAIYYLAYGIRKLVAQRYNIAVGGDPERIITMDPTDDYYSLLFGGKLEILVRATMTVANDKIKELGLTDFDDYLPMHHSGLFKDEAPEAIEQGLYDLGYEWLHHSDAGLFVRTLLELVAIKDGYEVVWPQLIDATPCGFNQIDVVTDLALIENT